MRKIAHIMYDGEEHRIYIYETMGGAGWGISIKSEGREASIAGDSELPSYTPLEQLAMNIAKNYVENSFRLLMSDEHGVGGLEG